MYSLKEKISDVAQSKPSCLSAVSGSYIYVITFYDYDHDIIKHVFLDEEKAVSKHKELQVGRSWGFYNLHKVNVE